MYKKNPIYLIIGGSLSGKTTLARNLSHRLNIACISSDDLRIVMQVGKREGSNIVKLKRSEVWKEPVEKIIKIHSKVSKKVNEGVSEIIDYHDNTNQSVIIEGDDIRPDFVKNIMNIYGSKIKAVCLYQDSEKIVRIRLEKRIRDQGRKKDGNFSKFLSLAYEENLIIAKESQKLGILTIKNDQFNTELINPFGIDCHNT